MNQQKSAREEVEAYIKQMNNYDPDLQEMGAKYLNKFILADKVNLLDDPELARKITENFLKQVASPHFVVHSAAIRFLAEMVPKLPKNQLIHIFHETIGSIAKPNTPTDRREVFTTAVGTMIHLAPDDFGHALSDLFVESINQLIMNKNKNTQIQMLLLNVITQFTRKWPNVTGSQDVKFDRNSFIIYLLNNIQATNKILLARKSDGALGKICLVFTHDNFQLLFNNKQCGLINFIRKHIKVNTEEELKLLKNGIMSLSHICKGHNPEMKEWARELTQICLDILENYYEEENHLELANQVLEHSIACLTSIVKAYYVELHLFTANQSLYQFIQTLINFDLEGMMNYLSSSEMQDEGQDQWDDDQYYSDDSVCWKVRVAVLRYITTIFYKDKGFRQKKAKQSQFIKSFTQKVLQTNQNVSKMAFQCFNSIIEQISPKKNKKYSKQKLTHNKQYDTVLALQMVQQMYPNLSLLLTNKKTKQQIKIQASKCLLHIIEHLKQNIKQNKQLNLQLLALALSFTTHTNTDICLNLLKSSKQLISNNVSEEKVGEIAELYLKSVKNKNLKIISTSFEGLRRISVIKGEEMVKNNQYRGILEAIIEKMKEIDADKLVKNSVIKCLGHIFSHLLPYLQETLQNQFLNVVAHKLHLQIDKSLILFQISKISKNFILKKSQQKIFDELLELCSDHLGSANFELNMNAVESTGCLITIKRNSLTERTAQKILSKCRSLLYELKIPYFVQILLQLHPNAFKQYVQLIIKTADSKYILGLLNNNITNTATCIETLKSIAKPDNAKRISLMLSQLSVSIKQLEQSLNNEQWGLICLGALGYIGNVDTLHFLLNLIEKSNYDEMKFEAARSIGNILSRNTSSLDQIMKLCKKQKDSYLYIFAIKEMLCFSQQAFPQYVSLLQFLLNKAEEENIRETNQYVIAESVGQASRINPSQMSKILSNISMMSEGKKYVIGNSLRYALENKNISQYQELSKDIQFYISTIMQLTLDQSFNVKTGSMKSLNSLTNNYLETLEHLFNQKLVINLINSILIKQENIIIVDYGVNKEKKDLAKPLRTESFNLINSLLNCNKIVAHYSTILVNTLNKISRFIRYLDEENSNDLILKRINIMKKICEKDFTLFIPYQQEFQTKMSIKQGILRTHEAKVDERNEGYLKNLLKEILDIQKIADKEGYHQIRAFVNNLRQSKNISKIIEGVE